VNETTQLSSLKQANPFAVQSASNNQTSGNALALSDQGRAIAEVQAAMIIARQSPRNQIAVMDKIINACTRPSLADAAVYQYSRGGTDISGPSIRLAEAIAQQWGNIQFGFNELSRGIDHDGVTYSEIGAYAWDLESNTRRPLQFRVRHWRDTKKGGYALKDERDIYELIANQAQRRVRACILAVIPGDVTEAAVKQCEITLKASADTSPEGIKKLLDAFDVFGVTKEQIEKRIQRKIDSIQPAQVVNLKKVYASLRDGMSIPDEWFEMIETKTTEDLKGKKPAPVSDVDEVKERKTTESKQAEQTKQPKTEVAQAKRDEPSPEEQAKIQQQLMDESNQDSGSKPQATKRAALNIE
jgi:hypothetical protein